jgi:pimeloyl-ACP methyl ester carboxylesterase
MNASLLDSSRLSFRRVPTPDLGAGFDGFTVVDLPTARLRLLDRGHGRTVVLIPDPPNLIEHHATMIRALERHCRVICFDPPGFGFSRPKRGFGFTVDDQAAVIVSLFERLQIREVVLGATCLLGFVAARVAKLRPDLIDRLVLGQVPSEAEARRWMHRVDFKGMVGTPVIGQLLMMTLPSRIAKSWYGAALPKGAPIAPMFEPTRRAFRAGAAYCLASSFQALDAAPVPDISGLEQAVTVCWGSEDRTHRRTDPRSFLEHVSHARHVTFEGCGHFPDLERPDEFIALMGL